MDISVIGIDIAKTVFHLVGIDDKGREVYRRKVKRSDLLGELSNISCGMVVMEACGGANYWAREIGKLGLVVKLIAAQHVKAYLKSNKNDWKDAAAIAEAGDRGATHFVTPKTLYQQDIQCLHRVRQQLIKQRTALCNEIRGFLLEYGVVVARGKRVLTKELALILQMDREKLTETAYELIVELKADLDRLDEKIEQLEVRLHLLSKQSPFYLRLLQIDGVGIISASAVIAAVGSPADFKNGRHFSAWLGLVPKQYSTGGRPRLLGISKRGDGYLRSLLIQGARVALRFCKGKTDARSRWAVNVSERRGFQKAAVALANRNARTIWAMLAHGTEFNASHQQTTYALAA
jgi:transposase